MYVVTADPRAAPATIDQPGLVCRACGAPLRHSVVDLGLSPPCQTVVRAEDLARGETFYPLHAVVCEACSLVQIDEALPPDAIFSDYAYFSSYSDSWVEHARRYTEAMRDRFGLGAQSQVVEVASNDGYLLQHFVALGVPCLGVEPAANVAAVAQARGIPTRVAFFGETEAQAMVDEGLRADLLLGNNVLAHTPHLNSFVAGLKTLLADDGVITIECPHLVELIDHNQFDTVYHEHFSYFSFTAAGRVFARHGLDLFDVERLPTHGGSLRLYGCHAGTRRIEARASEMLESEQAWGVDRLATYAAFAARVHETKRGLLDFLIGAARAGKTVAGYGAPGKGNTLLNYCGIRTDLLAYTVDRNPVKQGTFTPGTRIPIFAPERIAETRPDYVLILPWNLRDEIAAQMAHVREWGGRFVVPIPSVEVF